MKPLPRIRKTVKWGGAVVTVLLLVVWVGSGWQGLFWLRTRGHSYSCAYGAFFVGDSVTTPSLMDGFPMDWPPGLFFMPNYGNGFDWKPWWKRNAQGVNVSVPLWAPVTGLLAITLRAWRLDTLASRGARVGFCPKCDYDRTGLAAGAVCPECGKLPA